MKSFSEKILERERKGRRKSLLIVLLSVAFGACVGGGIGLRHNAPSYRGKPDVIISPVSGAATESKLDSRDLYPNPPPRIVINGQKWKLQVAYFDIPGEMGFTDCDNRIIQYRPNRSSSEMRETIMHEVFHAGDCLHGGENKFWNSEDIAHAGTYNLGEFTATFIWDNPELMKWLTPPNRELF